GRKIVFVGNAVNAGQSLAGAIHLDSGTSTQYPDGRLGCQVPTLSTNKPFQSVLCVGVRSGVGINQRKYLMVATINTKGDDALVLDSAIGAGIAIYSL
ncbi:hypothetical protein QT972_27180, partial [Microcoleus sp. herbarium7]|uniref:hypothetical protein n=1 Tax=Microcoleus sp. herbarium7 TaxID=3055435 RepID=UPI002FCFC48C